MNEHCPRCRSQDIKHVRYQDAECIVCTACGFDERDDLDQVSEERASQKEKGRYSPYKTGGSRRSPKG